MLVSSDGFFLVCTSFPLNKLLNPSGDPLKIRDRQGIVHIRAVALHRLEDRIENLKDPRLEPLTTCS